MFEASLSALKIWISNSKSVLSISIVRSHLGKTLLLKQDETLTVGLVPYGDILSTCT